MRLFLSLLSVVVLQAQAETLKVGSKRFTESYILGEIIVRTAGGGEHRQGLGNTGIVFNALKSGAIDLYPEYTGTALTTVLKQPPFPDARAVLGMVRAEYERQWKVAWLTPLG
ncbi:MAG TPA: glycine betaine ABC transporter substrate-binding protein, partial [Burkholderiales bacterium]|nr:glycine betaine ABC transporter substrate-binding protein [Burkholderiales bacterium]